MYSSLLRDFLGYLWRKILQDTYSIPQVCNSHTIDLDWRHLGGVRYIALQILYTSCLFWFFASPKTPEQISFFGSVIDHSFGVCSPTSNGTHQNTPTPRFDPWSTPSTNPTKYILSGPHLYTLLSQFVPAPTDSSIFSSSRCLPNPALLILSLPLTPNPVTSPPLVHLASEPFSESPHSPPPLIFLELVESSQDES